MGPGQLEIQELERPVTSEGDVLLRMRACGVCGTDVKTYLRGHPLIKPGSVLGHEIAGEVVESVHPDFTVGQRVAVAPYAPCGECRSCRRGRPSLCTNRGEAYVQPGGFSEYIRIPKRLVDVGMQELPADMSYELATLAEPLACCLHGLDALRLPANGTLLIIGDGPMGLMQAAIARAYNVSKVILVGMTPHRLEFAREVADVVIDGSQQDAVSEVLAHEPDGVDGVMASVASLDALEQGMRLVSSGGTLNVFAGMPKDASYAFDLKRIHYDEVSVVGTFGFGPDDFTKALSLLGEHGGRLEGLITHRADLIETEAALRAAGEQAGIKTVILGR